MREEIFDCLIDGKLESTLLIQLAECPLVNALSYSRRPNIWSVLPPACRDAVRMSTAQAWVRALPDSVTLRGFVRPEADLASVLAGPNMERQMAEALRALTFSEVLEVFAGNVCLKESLLRTVFGAFYCSGSKPKVNEVQRLGRLVSSRGWSDFTRHVMSQYGMVEGLRVFFEICAEHLEIWDRWRHNISEPTRTQLYALLVETACELYPAGPMEAEIWVRAGGDPSKLDRSGSGHWQWEGAIRRSRYGGGVRPRVLISEMREDYPLSERLVYLGGRWR